MKTILKERTVMVQFYADNEAIEMAIVYMLANNVPVKKIDIPYIESHLIYLYKLIGEQLINYVIENVSKNDINYHKNKAKSIAKKLFPEFYIEYKD